MSSAASGQGLVLLVEDDAAVRAVVTVLLEDEGWRVEEATDGLEGWELARLMDPRVIITDLRMPRMTGIEMAERLSAGEDVLPPLVAITADDDSLRQRAQDSGLFVEVIHKPLDPERFLGVVRRSALPDDRRGEGR